MKNLRPFKLERYYTLYEHTSKYSLCNSDCEAMTIKDLLNLENGAEEQLHNTWLGYTKPKGDPILRTAIASLYDHISPEDITVCTGAQEPIFLYSHAALEKGDEVIVQSPYYQSLASVPESIGCQVREWMVRYKDNQPYFDLDELKKIITDKTKAIHLNAPHNPTGYLFTKEEQKAIIDLARSQGIIVFCDEVYRELEQNPADRIPTIADVYENGVTVGVMSKAYGLPGLRIGWVVTKNSKILDRISVLKEYTTICNVAPSEFLAGVALRNRAQILERNLDIIRSNMELYSTFFDKYSHLFSWNKPNAGPVAFIKMLFDNDDTGFAEKVLKKQGVLILPGGIYDYEGYFRIGMGRKKIPEALEQFEIYVQENLMK